MELKPVAASLIDALRRPYGQNVKAWCCTFLSRRAKHMRFSTPKAVAVLSVGLPALIFASPTPGQPAAVSPGDANVPVPIFPGGSPTMTPVGNIGGSATMNGISIQYDEEAFVSSLNPGF